MEILNRLNIKPNNEYLFETAFTHTSYSNEYPECDNYERLEFLGDAVLEIIISDYLYNEKYLEEGTMTKMRASYVCELACATYADDLGFNDYIRLGSGENNANETILNAFENYDSIKDRADIFSKELLDAKPKLAQKIIDVCGK